MDEVYRGFRMTTKQVDGVWTVRVTHVRGRLINVPMRIAEDETEATCLARCREAIERYLRYLET